MKKHIKALFCSKDGLVSVSKFWTNIGSCAATYIVIKMANSGTLSVELFAIYCTALIAPNLAQKMSYIFKGQNNQQNYVDTPPMRDYTPNNNVDRPE